MFAEKINMSLFKQFGLFFVHRDGWFPAPPRKRTPLRGAVFMNPIASTDVLRLSVIENLPPRLQPDRDV